MLDDVSDSVGLFGSFDKLKNSREDRYIDHHKRGREKPESGRRSYSTSAHSFSPSSSSSSSFSSFSCTPSNLSFSSTSSHSPFSTFTSTSSLSTSSSYSPLPFLSSSPPPLNTPPSPHLSPSSSPTSSTSIHQNSNHPNSEYNLAASAASTALNHNNYNNHNNYSDSNNSPDITLRNAITNRKISYSSSFTIVPTYECFNLCTYCNFRTNVRTDNSQMIKLSDVHAILTKIQKSNLESFHEFGNHGNGIHEILILSGIAFFTFFCDIFLFFISLFCDILLFFFSFFFFFYLKFLIIQYKKNVIR